MRAARCWGFILGLTASIAGAEAADTVGVTLLGTRREAKQFRTELRHAWDAYGRSHPDEAEPWFRRVVEAESPPATDLCEALFGLGWCHAFRRPLSDTKGAEALFGRIVREFPGDPLAPWALIELGNLRTKKGEAKQEAGRKYYRQVLADYGDSPAVHEATMRLANSLLYELKDPEMTEGATLLERHLVRNPDNPLAVIMHFRLDYYYGDIRLDYAACLPHAIRVAEMKLSDPFRWSRQYWHVAEILRLRLGRAAESAAWYRRIVEECPTSMQALAASEILASLEKRSSGAKGDR